MPKINNIDLPTVTVSGADPDALSSKLATEKMPVEAMVETIVYLIREREKADALKVAEDVLRGRIMAHYAALPESLRGSVRTEVGLVTYADGGETVKAKDRDLIVESLTAEQLRISYIPDLKALETILKKDAFDRLVTRSPSAARITIRPNRGSTDYSELDY